MTSNDSGVPSNPQPSAPARAPARPDLSFDPRDVQASNISGSTAGASSSDFHIYRRSRARELARLQDLRAAREEKAKDAEFEKEKEERRQKEEDRTEKRAKKRRRRKQRVRDAKRARKEAQKESNETTGGQKDGQ